MEHIADSDFTDPFVPPGMETTTTTSFQPNAEAVARITEMGFTRGQAVRGLKATDNNFERAIDWLFSHDAEGDDEEMQSSSEPKSTYRDGNSSKF